MGKVQYIRGKQLHPYTDGTTRNGGAHSEEKGEAYVGELALDL